MAADPAATPDVADLLAVAATEAGQRVALVEPGGRRLTWGELDTEVSRVATGLGRLGVVAGNRVLLALGNRLELVSCYLGSLRAQAVAVPVDPRSTAAELVRMLADSGARVAIADAASVSTVREAVVAVAEALRGGPTDLDPDLLVRAVVPQVVVAGAAPAAGETPYDEVAATVSRPVPPLPDPEKLAALLYTSGTSGAPRAAMLTHRALLANVDQVARVAPPMVTGQDMVLGVLPLFHVYGLGAVLGSVLRQHATLVVADHLDAAATLDLVAEQRCTVVPVAPPVLARWLTVDGLADRLATVRVLLSGSAPLAPEVAGEITARTGVPVHQGYGLTEAAPVVTSTLCSTVPRRGSVGAALPGIAIRLREEDGSTPEGEDVGEVELRGPNLFSGYWPDGSGGPDEDGWWSTGDLGFLDAAGELSLVDRVREVVVVSGFNVYPAEVEDVIREVAGVTGAAVVGVDDEDTGEAVVAWVRAPGQDPGAIADAVRTHCAERLARFKRPRRVEVVDELPMTGTGKVRKGRLRGLERRRHDGLLG